MKKVLLSLCLCSCILSYGQFANEVKETSSNRITEDYFGYSVASQGPHSLVGAPQSNLHGLNSIPSSGNGYAEFFELTLAGIQSVQQVQPSVSTSNERFGFDVSVFGNFAAISAPYHELDANNQNPIPLAGAVFIYEYSNGQWQFSQKIVPANRALVKEFGYSIDMYEDVLLIGAPGDQAGLAGQTVLNYSGAGYFYRRNSAGQYQLEQKVVASQREDVSFFGYSVSLDETAAAIGSPFHYLDNFDLNPIPYSGATYIFDFDGTQWNQTQKVVAFDRYQNQVFGLRVAVNNSPRQLAVGTMRDSDGLPGTTSIFEAGAVYVYTDYGFGFANDAKILSQDRDLREGFGCSLDLNDSYLAVGGRRDSDNMNGVFEVDTAGAVYLYNAGSSSWTFTQKIIPSDREAGDHFGQDVALNSFDTLGVTSYGVVVGAWKEDHDNQGGNYMERSGSAYFYGYTTIGLEDRKLESVLVYPNPTTDQITLVGLQRNENLTLLNSLGQIYLQKKAETPETTFDLTHLPAGLYTLKIDGPQGVQTQQIVKH